MVGRVEVGEKPDVLWELPGLSRLFTRLSEMGVIAVERKTIRILDPAKLRDLAGEIPGETRRLS